MLFVHGKLQVRGSKRINVSKGARGDRILRVSGVFHDANMGKLPYCSE